MGMACKTRKRVPENDLSPSWLVLNFTFTFLVPAHLGSPGQWAVKRVYTDIAKFAGHLPHRQGNQRAIWDHTVLPATRQR